MHESEPLLNMSLRHIITTYMAERSSAFNRKEIMRLYRQHLRTDVIADQLGLTRRHVQRVIAEHVGPSRGDGKSKEHALKQIRHTVVGVLRAMGRDYPGRQVRSASHKI